MTMKKRPETKEPVPDNPNDHKVKTPDTKRDRTDKKFTSYDTKNPETSTPQKVRESKESTQELDREKKAR